MNPIAYLLVSLQFTSLMLAIIFLIAWFEFGRHKYALLWSIAFFIASVQWVLNLGSQYFFASYDAYWLTVNLISIVTTALALAGHRLRVRLQNRLSWYLLAGGITWVLVACFTLQQPHVGLRTAIVPLYTAVIMLLLTCAVLRYPRVTRPAEWGLATVTALFAICETAAAAVVLSGGAAGNASVQAKYLTINFLSLPAIYTGMGLFTVLILASDMSKEMKSLALMDSLTGILNLRGLREEAGRLLAAARRKSEPLSVLICDLDFFKAINDRYGHAAGDNVLRQFATHLRAQARAYDVIARVGGEEFVVLLPNTSLQAAAMLAERLRTSLASLVVNVDVDAVQVEASFGVAAFGDTDKDIVDLVKRADTALYQSKRNGRNQVTLAP